MILPAQAFGEIYPMDLAAGSVFRFQRQWALVVGYEAGKTHDFLMLAGDHAGRLYPVDGGMARCMSILAPFTWFAAVASSAVPAASEQQTTTLTLTSAGPVVIGAQVQRGYPEYIAFRLDGSVDRTYQDYGTGLRFADWTAELQHPARPFESLGRLFSVGSPPAP